MTRYHVTGMSCAACSSRIEKAVLKVDGVTECSVSLLTNSMGVEGNASSANVINAVRQAGYDASLAESKNAGDTAIGTKSADAIFADGNAGEIEALGKRLAISAIFLAILIYFSMGTMLWNLPVPEFLNGNHVGMGMVQLLLSAAIMVVNQKFFISGFKGMLNKSPNMDTLVAMGSAVSFLYSICALFAMTYAQLREGHEAASAYMDEFYFETAAMILTLITVGKMLEARSKGKTADALRGLIKLAPQTANIIKDGEELTIPIESLKKGDIFVVRPGESVPADGIVLEGTGVVNESALTGESIPADKKPGDRISAATLNQSGFLKCEAQRTGGDTTLSQIIKLISDAAATKAPIAKIADRVSGIFVPVVMAISAFTFIIWMIVGESIGFSLARAISVLVISCPCALGLATPVAIMAGSGVGAKNAILFKTAASLEEMGKLQIVALDKTGTITKGEPEVTDIISMAGYEAAKLLMEAASIENKSAHPLAGAIMKKAREMGISHEEVSDFRLFAGNGLMAKSGENELCAGNYSFISEKADVSEEAEKIAGELAERGKTPIFFSKNGILIGIIAVADMMKEDSPEAVRELKNMGLHVVMLTGDNEKTARAIGKQAGADEIIAGVLPDGKENVIKKLKEKGRVAMVGDGINDAPALMRADMGIAIGAGTDVAIDAADVVLMKSRLSDVPAAIRLSRATGRNIRENLFWAFFYNMLGIPLAAGVFIKISGYALNPMFGAAAMSLSSFCVVTNALRLNFVDIRKSKVKGKDMEVKMKKVIKIEGMMCGHCEAAVKKALEALSMVKEAQVSSESGSATVTLSEKTDDAVLKETVEALDYKVTQID